jgi:hypothetical protein
MYGIFTKTAEQLVREDVERQALEAAASKVELLSGNSTYTQAWKTAAKLIRSMKP